MGDNRIGMISMMKGQKMARATIRVCYSNDGLDIIPKANPKRVGDGYETKTYWMVKWDGCLGFTPYAKLYIAKAEDEKRNAH